MMVTANAVKRIRKEKSIYNKELTTSTISAACNKF